MFVCLIIDIITRKDEWVNVQIFDKETVRQVNY
jgi:hypothetical protein